MVKIQANLVSHCHLHIFTSLLKHTKQHVYILVELLFFSEKKKTSTSVFYVHVHTLLASKYYDMKERNEKKKKGVFYYLYNLDGQS